LWRIFGLLADHEDQDDHDTLRYDPIFKLIANRSPDGLPWPVNQPCRGLKTPSPLP